MEREDKIRRQLASNLTASAAGQNGRPLVFRTYEELWFGGPYRKRWAGEHRAFLHFLFAQVCRDAAPKGDISVSMDSGYTAAQVQSVIQQAARRGLVLTNVRQAEGGEHVITFRELNKYDFLNLNWRESFAGAGIGLSENAPPAPRDAIPDTPSRWQPLALAQCASVLAAVMLYAVFGADAPPFVYLAVISSPLVVVVALALAGKLAGSRARTPATAPRPKEAAAETPGPPGDHSVKSSGDGDFSLPFEPSLQYDLERIFSSTSPEPNTLTVGLCQQILSYSGDEEVVREYVLDRMPTGKGSTTYLLEEYVLMENSARGKEACKEVLRDLLSLVQLQQMAKSLNVEHWRNPDPDLLAESILKSLGFKVCDPPSGIEKNLSSVCKYQKEFQRARSKDEYRRIGSDVGAEWEEVLNDVVHLYCHFLWGAAYEEELRHYGFLDRSGGGGYRSLKESPLGKVGDVLQKVNAVAESDAALRNKTERQFGRRRLFPDSVFASNAEATRVINTLNKRRNYFVHALQNAEFKQDSVKQVQQKLEDFINRVLELFEAFRESQFYPPVVCYHATSRNPSGERFVECLRENGKKLIIRTDELMREEGAYFCWAHGNPIAIRPLLIPKER